MWCNCEEREAFLTKKSRSNSCCSSTPEDTRHVAFLGIPGNIQAMPLPVVLGSTTLRSIDEKRTKIIIRSLREAPPETGGWHAKKEMVYGSLYGRCGME